MTLRSHSSKIMRVVEARPQLEERKEEKKLPRSVRIIRSFESDKRASS